MTNHSLRSYTYTYFLVNILYNLQLSEVVMKLITDENITNPAITFFLCTSTNKHY
jgi:hypothetical protein